MDPFKKLKGWTLGTKYDEGLLTGIQVNPDNTVTLDMDYGKEKILFKMIDEQWRIVKKEKV